MKVRVLGGGWYGCHIARALLSDGHEVELHETGPRLFHGASGNNPARLHIGCHYPRSMATRAACQAHAAEFAAEYGHLTRSVRTNIYAVARDHSLMDFGTYTKVLRDEIEFLTVAKPGEYGLRNVEGAIMVAERHIVIDDARRFFESALEDSVKLNAPPATLIDDPTWGLTIDATFCANEAAGVDRYEPCLVLLLQGPTDTAITIMDGPFPSLYPWNESRGLCSLSSARYTPFSKTCESFERAKAILDGLKKADVEKQGDMMVASMSRFYPGIEEYGVSDYRLSIRAMPLSGADSRLVDVVRVGERALRVRAGKIDAVAHAARLIRGALCLE